MTLSTYEINGNFSRKMFNADHALFACFKHSMSYFQFESEKDSAFKD